VYLGSGGLTLVAELFFWGKSNDFSCSKEISLIVQVILIRAELNPPNFDILTFVDSFTFRESPYRKTPKLDRIFCKSASFLFNLAMFSTNRKKELHVVVGSKLHTGTISSTHRTEKNKMAYKFLNS